jgi:putative transposase
MKKTRFTGEQMVTSLRETGQQPVPEVAKKHGVSAPTIYAWRKHFGTLEPVDVKRQRQLEQECLAIDVAGGIRSGRVIEVLVQLVNYVAVHGHQPHEVFVTSR